MIDTLPIINKKIEAFANPRIFLTNRGSVMDNIMPYFFTTWLNKARAAVLFQDILGNGLKYATEAKKRNTPIVVVQHGRGAVVDYLPPENHPLIADKICVWGPRDREMLVSGGIDPKKVILTGCPIFHGLRPEKEAHKGINILFAPGHLKETGKNIAIMDLLRSVSGINIYAKLLTVHDRKIYGKNAIVSNSFDKDHIKKCIGAVRKADILITTSSGTIETLAMYFGVPVIFMDIHDEDEFKEHCLLKRSRLRPLGTYYIDDINALPDAIKKTLKDPSMLVKAVKDELYAAAGIGLPGSPVLKIVDTIKKEAK